MIIKHHKMIHTIIFIINHLDSHSDGLIYALFGQPTMSHSHSFDG
jgi:hypothetical protein